MAALRNFGPAIGLAEFLEQQMVLVHVFRCPLNRKNGHERVIGLCSVGLRRDNSHSLHDPAVVTVNHHGFAIEARRIHDSSAVLTCDARQAFEPGDGIFGGLCAQVTEVDASAFLDDGV